MSACWVGMKIVPSASAKARSSLVTLKVPKVAELRASGSRALSRWGPYQMRTVAEDGKTYSDKLLMVPVVSPDYYPFQAGSLRL